MNNFAYQDIAIVAIGRNEGERLRACLRSIENLASMIVYVDSGSIDGSLSIANSFGCKVVELDPSQPMSAARARNAGFDYVMETVPDLPFVQFLDGDCELSPDWLRLARAALMEQQPAAIVCGHIRERFPNATIYNRICDIGWRQAAGEVRSSGGIFMIRSRVFQEAGGFRPDVIAAEDDEFCVRVRHLGNKILYLDSEMVRHDSAMTSFGQWWRRARRTGHAFAQVSALHGKEKERYFVRDARKVWLWGFALPLAAILLVPWTGGYSLALLFAAYLLQWMRTFLRARQRGWTFNDSFLHACFSFLFKFPAFLGLVEYHWRRWRGNAPTIIEYKRRAGV